MWANCTFNFKFFNVSDGVTLKGWGSLVYCNVCPELHELDCQLRILSHSSMFCIIGWETIYILNQNGQRRALIIEEVTESKERLPPLLLRSLLTTPTESHCLSSKHNYLNFKDEAGASSVVAAPPPIDCAKLKEGAVKLLRRLLLCWWWVSARR